MVKVPRIKLGSRPRVWMPSDNPTPFERPCPIWPVGYYQGTIVDIHEPKEMRTRGGMFHVGIKVEINLNKVSPWVKDLGPRYVFTHMAGFMNIIIMVYRNRHMFFGKEVQVRIRHTTRNGVTYPDVQIIWDTEATTTTPATTTPTTTE